MSAKWPRSQEGFASLVIAIVLVLVLSLITVGFAQLMRREQKSALDKHLSNEAYYAAESGINDAAKAINDGYTAAKTICGIGNGSGLDGGVNNSMTGASYLENPVIGNATDGVSYPCLTINPLPTTLEYSAIDKVDSKVVYITGVDPTDPTGQTTAPIQALNISWQDANGNTNFRTSGQTTFAPASGSGKWDSDTSVLRISLTKLVSGQIDRANLVDNTYTAFLYPDAGSQCDATQPATTCPSYSFASGIGSNGSATGLILSGSCHKKSTPRYCNVQIKDLGAPSYLLDMRSIYSTSRVTISAVSYSGTFLQIKNAQTVVDATGKAQDILRRIQVRIPSKNNYPHTDFDLESMNGICKQMQLLPGSVLSSGCSS